MTDAHTVNILLVDDDAPALLTLQAILEPLGQTLIKARSGREALRHLLNHEFAVVLLDVQMADMDGFETAMLMRERDRTRHVPIIFLTAAQTTEGHVFRGYAVGAADYVIKPLEPEILRSKVSVFVELARKSEIVRRQALSLRESERKAREHAERAERESRYKSKFLANMSHEIRTPMNAILGYTQLLQRRPGLDPEQFRYLDIIRRSGDHLLDLINDVLEMSKIEAGHQTVNLGTVHLPALLTDVEAMFRLRAEVKHLSFELNRAADVPHDIISDEGKLRQILVNLLGNAVKFTEEGGVVTRFLVRHGPADHKRLLIEIEDTGPGIDAADLVGLFRPFTQARVGIEARGGTGLGLALSREFARLLGGDITVESTAGRGSTFRIDLPIAVASASPSHADRALGRVAGLAPEVPSPRILIAEDHEESRFCMCKLLEEIGFDVRVAADGPSALAIVDAWKPSLVLMDLYLPVMDGRAAMRAIRARPDGAAVIIIAMTASSFDENHDEIVAAGASAWLRKPCREDALFQEIARFTGVRYRYAAPDAPCSAAAQAAPDESLSAAGALPRDLRAPIGDAARVADFERLSELLDELPAHHTATAAELRRLLERYAYDEIERRMAPDP